MKTNKKSIVFNFDNIIVALIILINVLFIGEYYYEINNTYNELTKDYGVIEVIDGKKELLVYDSETYIVYKAKLARSHKEYDFECNFASNGLPYVFNTESSEIEMLASE